VTAKTTAETTAAVLGGRASPVRTTAEMTAAIARPQRISADERPFPHSLEGRLGKPDEENESARLEWFFGPPISFRDFRHSPGHSPFFSRLRRPQCQRIGLTLFPTLASASPKLNFAPKPKPQFWRKTQKENQTKRMSRQDGNGFLVRRFPLGISATRPGTRPFFRD